MEEKTEKIYRCRFLGKAAMGCAIGAGGMVPVIFRPYTGRNPGESNSDFISVQSLRGREDSGEVIYNNNCKMCHGIDGSRKQVITINNPDLLAVATDKYRSLNSQERHDIVTCLRQWQRVVIKKQLTQVY